MTATLKVNDMFIGYIEVIKRARFCKKLVYYTVLQDKNSKPLYLSSKKWTKGEILVEFAEHDFLVVVILSVGLRPVSCYIPGMVRPSRPYHWSAVDAHIYLGVKLPLVRSGGERHGKVVVVSKTTPAEKEYPVGIIGRYMAVASLAPQSIKCL